MTMKRGFTNGGEVAERLAMANCLMLLSNSNTTILKPIIKKQRLVASEVFECKTCNRQFPSFQALGGHRASHKKPRLMTEKLNGGGGEPTSSSTSKPKLHECTICGQQFSMGQALGGHMRRHRIAAMDGSLDSAKVVSKLPVFRRSNSKRVFGLDLNLTPLENDLEILFGKMAPKVDLFMI